MSCVAVFNPGVFKYFVDDQPNPFIFDAYFRFCGNHKPHDGNFQRQMKQSSFFFYFVLDLFNKVN